MAIKTFSLSLSLSCNECFISKWFSIWRYHKTYIRENGSNQADKVWCIGHIIHMSFHISDNLGPDSIKRCHLTSIGNPIVEIRRSYDRLISTMGFHIPVRRHLYIESGPWSGIISIWFPVGRMVLAVKAVEKKCLVARRCYMISQGTVLLLIRCTWDELHIFVPFIRSW